jgi:hypothetical protein
MFGGFDYARVVMWRQEMAAFCIFGNFGGISVFYACNSFGVFLNGFLFFARIFILSVFFGIRILYLVFFCRYVLCAVRAVCFRARALLAKGSRC